MLLCDAGCFSVLVDPCVDVWDLVFGNGTVGSSFSVMVGVVRFRFDKLEVSYRCETCTVSHVGAFKQSCEVSLLLHDGVARFVSLFISNSS